MAYLNLLNITLSVTVISSCFAYIPYSPTTLSINRSMHVLLFHSLLCQNLSVCFSGHESISRLKADLDLLTYAIFFNVISKTANKFLIYLLFRVCNCLRLHAYFYYIIEEVNVM